MIRLGPFLLSDVIGHGGMGTVWAGKHLLDDRPVAVKVLAGNRALSERFSTLLRREGRLLASLSHPGIVQVLDQGEIDEEAARASNHELVAGSPYLVLERVNGGTLSPFLGTLTWEDTREVLDHVLAALAHAHARGILHRDLKPENLLLHDRTTWAVKLTDFGIATLRDEAIGPTIAGTPMFMSPEQEAGAWRMFRPATDLFAVGRLTAALLSPSALVPAALPALMERLHAEQPQRRFTMAADVLAALKQLGPSVVPLPDRYAAGRLPSECVTHPRQAADLGADRACFHRNWRSLDPGRHPPPPNAGGGLLGTRHPELVGRESERDALWRALERVHTEGGSQVVVIEGEEGIGKRALARDICERAYALGAAWPLYVPFDPVQQGLESVTYMVAQKLGTVGLSPAEAHQHILGMAAHFAGVDLVVLESLVDALHPREAGGQTRAESLQLCARYVEWASSQRPVVLVLEEVQWSVEGVELVRLFLESLHPGNLLLLLTVDPSVLARSPVERDGVRALLTDHADRVSRLKLGPLPERDQAELVRGLLGLDPDVVTQIVRSTQGHPLRTLQQVHTLHESGRLRKGPRGFQLDRPLAGSSLDRLLARRLADFLATRSTNSRICVGIFAVFGGEVDAVSWAAACGRMQAVPSRDLAEAMVQRGFLDLDDHGFYRFTHPSLRAAAQQLANDEGRLGAFHLACAEHWADQPPSTDRDARQGQHLLAAGRARDALPLLLSPAMAALEDRQSTLAEAWVSRWQQALERAELPAEAPEHGTALRLQAELAAGTYDFDRAEALWTELGRDSAQRGWTEEQVRALFGLALVIVHRGDTREATRHLERALALSENGTLLQARVHEALGRCFRTLDVERCQKHAALARTVFARHHDVGGEVSCLLLAAGVALHQARPDEALTLAETARHLAKSLGRLRPWADALTMVGEIHRAEGRLALATDAYSLASRILRSGQSSTRAVASELNLALTHQAQQQHAEALQACEPVLLWLAERKMLGLEGIAHCVMLPSLAALSRERAFERHLAMAELRAQSPGYQDGDALACLEDAARTARQQGWTALALRTALLAQQLDVH